MYMDGNSYETLMASLIHSAPKAADTIKSMLLAYAKTEDFEPYLEHLDSRLHNTIRTMVHELNTIEDPETLDREVDRLLAVIDRLVQELDEAKTLPQGAASSDETGVAKRRRKKAKKTGAKKKSAGPAKKKPASKKPASKKPASKKPASKKPASKKAPVKKKKAKAAKASKKAGASKPAKKAKSAHEAKKAKTTKAKKSVKKAKIAKKKTARSKAS
jgi:outer membrane biosynthesis protein TonB